MRKAAAFAVFLFSAALSMHAQSFDASAAGGPVIITAPWRLHTGDHAAWASPSFDDSQWALHPIETSWADQDLRDYSGYIWLRLRVRVPATSKPLALLVFPLADAEEVYADGILIGMIGQMRPQRSRLVNESARVLPLSSAVRGGTVELAIRVWRSRFYTSSYGSGAGRLPVLGTQADLTRIVQLAHSRDLVVQADSWLLAVVAAVFGLFSLGLFLFRRQATEYCWAALFLLGTAIYFVFLAWLKTCSLEGGAFTFFSLSFDALVETAWLFFLWRFLRSKYDRLFYAALIVNWVRPTAPLWVMYGPASVSQAFLLGTVAHLSISVLVLAKLLPLVRSRNRDAQLLLIPFLLNSAVLGLSEARSALQYSGYFAGNGSLAIYAGHGFQVTWDDLSLLLSFFAIGAVLVLRFTKSAQQAQRLSSEMNAARKVQSLLIPRELPIVLGIGLDAAYFPAAEVGGDLYQVFQQPDGSLLVAIGDVSGKGLKAAMLGTLVVGALRSLAQENLPPAEILFRLNRQLADSTDGGFVTCCIARIDADGQVTVANAGHLPPYRNGEEVSLDSSLPLGISASTEFCGTTLQLACGDNLTFLSDGVVEARNTAGELFGFDRAREISNQLAEQIAIAAQAFGQEDDITVLTLQRETAHDWNKK